MISRNSDKGFLAAHWDWLVAGIGIVGLVAAAAVMVMACGEDPDEAAAEALAELGSRAGAKTGVEPVSMAPYALATKGLESPAKIAEPAASEASFLASERRVFCEQGNPLAEKKNCGCPIPFGLKECPYCGAVQPEEKKIELDSDGDGIPDEFEKKYGLDPNDPSDVDGDKDGDGFTNKEEFEAGTDLADAASHPPYVDSLRIQLPLKETLLPFYLERIMPTPSGDRFYFKMLKAKVSWAKGSTSLNVLKGEEIGGSGFSVTASEKKTRKQKIKGSNVEREVDVSSVTIVRKSDGKTLTLVINEKHTPVDIQATLVYERGATKEFTVVPGDTVDLNGTKYKVIDIKRENKGAKVTVENSELGKKTLEALEQ